MPVYGIVRTLSWPPGPNEQLDVQGLWLAGLMELTVRARKIDLPATLTRAEGPVRAGVVVLHGAEAGARSYFLYEHLSAVLPAQGVAVLRFDRRPSTDGNDIALEVQAQDALAAARCLRDHIQEAPVGLWGFSQGAWAAPLAAVVDPGAVAFLVCVSACGVSPAEQMRIGAGKQLLKAGHAVGDVEELTQLRLEVEHYLRGKRDRATTQAMLDEAAARPWFAHAYLPPSLPDPGAWADMDFDPEPILARVSCPVLAFYGETDEWMPIEESISAWRKAEGEGHPLDDLTVMRLDGTDHLPTFGGQPDPEAISPLYTATLTGWINDRFGPTSS